MTNYIISSDTNCKLSKEYLKNNDIYLVDMPFSVGSEEHENEENVDYHKLYQAMRDGAPSRTSQVNLFCAEEFLKSLLEKGKDVIHICFSSALSGTYNNFVKVAEELNSTSKNKIYLIDSLGGAGGQDILVQKAVDNRAEGMNIEENHNFLEKFVQRIANTFILEDLKFLARGGRITKAMATLGCLLKIKPLVHADANGRLTQVSKIPFRKKAILKLFEFFKARYSGESKEVYVYHGDCEADAQKLATDIRNAFPDANVHVDQLCLILGCHSGPDVLCIFYTEHDRSEITKISIF